MSAGNSAYSPLPQSNSDSDCSSEEELHVSQGNRIVNRTAKVQNSKDEKANDEQKNNFINYKLLDNDGEVGVALNKFLSAPNEVSILKPDSGKEIFSTSRKICFIFSLLLCVFTTIAFIWILPCNVESCISASNVRNSNFTWEENLTNLEIYGPITLVSDKEKQHNLLFLTRSHLDSGKNYSESGLSCLRGRDGSPLWHLKLDEEATDIDCKLIDINADGINDCLVHSINFLNAVNPVSGKKLWDIQKSNKKEQRLFFKDFPLVIPDLDKDKTKELLLPCSLAATVKGNYPEVEFQNYLVIISGKTGLIINKPLQIKSCSSIHNLMFENSSILSYTCFNSNKKAYMTFLDTIENGVGQMESSLCKKTGPNILKIKFVITCNFFLESFQKISFTDIFKSLKNPSEETADFPKWDMLKRHMGDQDTISISGFRLILENQGSCPENCDVVVYIKDERPSSVNKTVYYFKQKSTFGMAPLVLKTKNESGFILKFWRWSPKAENSGTKLPIQKTGIIRNISKNLTKRSKKVKNSKAENSNTQNTGKLSAQKIGLLKNDCKNLIKRSKNLLNNSNNLEKEMLLESEWESQRMKRTATKLHRNRFGKSALNSGTFNLYVISETIVKLALNQSQVSVSNVTKDEIVQICKTQVCQPNVDRQKHSVLVTAFDEAGADKLITFTTSYIHEVKEDKKDLETWKLQSKIRVLNL